MTKVDVFKTVTMALHDNIRQINYFKMDEFRGPGKQHAVVVGLWHFLLGAGWGYSDFSQFEFPSRHLIALQQLMHRSNVQRITHEMQLRQSKPRSLFFTIPGDKERSSENCVSDFRYQHLMLNSVVFFRNSLPYRSTNILMEQIIIII